MEGVLEQIPEGGRVLVIRLRSLGDCVLTTPAISLLKAHRPDLRVSVVVEDRFAAVYEGNSEIEELLSPSVGAVAGSRPDLCLNLHGGTRSIAMTTASGARFRAGFAHYRAAALYNVRIPTAQEILGVDRIVHTAEHVASAIFYLGVPKADIPRAKLAAPVPAVDHPYAVIHAQASAADKTWPAEHFQEVALHLKTQCGLQPVFIGAAGDDMRAFVAYEVRVGASLTAIKKLMAGASLFVGNDSGPAHMAAAFGLPVVVMFGNSNAEIWGPWRTESVVLQSPDGIAAIHQEEAIAAVDSLRVRA
jgi:lipopolysaccharide heptosyltransferase III